MRLTEIAVDNPVMTIMAFIAIFIFGIVAVTMIPKDVLPEIEMPTLTIITVYPGANANEVESQVTDKLEGILAGTSSLKSIKSISRENVSIVTMQFNWGTDLNDASNSVRDLMELVKKDLPNDARNPMIMKITSSMLPVVFYSIEAEESYNGLDKLVEDMVSGPIKKVQGVGTTFVLGQPEREIKVECDPFRLSAYHLSITQLSQALATQNVSIPAGNMKLGNSSLAVRVPAEFTSIDDIANTPIISINNQVIRVRDVATITDGFKEQEEYLHSSGKQAVLMMVQKQSGANTLQVAKAVGKEIQKIKSTLPADVQIKEVINSSELVSESIKNLTWTIIYAAVFVILVVLFFLREVRSSVIIILTIPFSLIIAFVYMFIAKFSINIFSLMSLAIAIGMVVDNAIVVLENITRHMAKGSKPREAAIFGASEMEIAIAGSTLTTIVVFIPMIFMGGLVGILFKQLAILVSITLLASLVTALSLTPMLSARWLGTNKAHNPGKFFTLSEKCFTWTEQKYVQLLAYAIKHRKRFIFGAISLLALSLFMVIFIGTDYIPAMDAGDLNAVIELDNDVSSEQTASVAAKVEEIFINEVPELRSMYSVTGQTESGLLSTMGFKEGRNVSTIGTKLVLPDKRKRSAKELEAVIRAKLDKIPEICKFRVVGGSLLQSAMFANSKPVEIKISGKDMSQLSAVSAQLYNALANNSKLVNLESSLDKGTPELQVIIDKQKASALGVNPALAAIGVRQSLYGVSSTQYKDSGDEYDIRIRLTDAYRNDTNALSVIPVNCLDGNVVPLGSIAEFKMGSGYTKIEHDAQQRTVYLCAELKDISLGEAIKEVKAILAKQVVPAGVDVRLAGQYEDQQSSFRSLILMFILGCTLVYMVMASIFGSYKDPMIIMFAIPLALIGVIWAFFVSGISLSVITFIGIVMLLGIVVNNGIVLIDYTHLLRKRGQSLHQAVVNAGKSRLRPVLMTAFTTIFGMIPMAYSHGMGSEIWSPLGITCIGGLLISTVITLVLVPVIYTSMHKHDSEEHA